MKERMLKSIVLAVCFVVALVGISIALNKNKKSDAIVFKEAYESLNNELNAAGTAKYLAIEIPKDNPMTSATIDEILDLIDQGTGVIYFGRPTCPWCRNAVPILIEAAKTIGLKKIYYFDMDTIKNEWKLEDGKPVKTKQEKDGYYDLLKALDEYLRDYTLTDEEENDISVGEKRVYVPMVLVVQDGKVLGSKIGTVDLPDGQTAYDPLTKEQREEVLNDYTDLLDLLSDDFCTEECE